VATISKNEISQWLKIGAQLRIVFKCTIHSSPKQIFCDYETYSKVWEQDKLLYTSDILYNG